MAHIETGNRATTFRALGPVFFYFFVAGIATVMLGPLLPSLIERWHIQDAEAGTLFTASFAGQLCGSWFGTRNLRASVLYGAFLAAAACTAMVLVGFSAAHIALFCVGIGLGAGLTAGNVIAGTVLPSARARLLAILNVSWSAGAIACPVLVRACGPDGTIAFFYLTAATLAAAGVFAIAIPHQMSPPDETATLPESQKQSQRRILLPPFTLFVFVAAMYLYVGVENALGGWLPSYGIRMNPSAHAPTIALCFWVAQLAGRLLMAVPKNLFNEITLYRISAAMLIFTVAVLLATSHLSPSSMVAITILSGLTIAPVYPLIVAFLLVRTGSHPRLGPIFASASLGGATLPWLTGVVSTQFHGLRAGLLVPAIGAVLLLLISSVIAPERPNPAAFHSST